MGRKPIFGEVATSTNFRLYSWEKQLVRDFIKKLREKLRKQLERKRNGIRRRI